MLVGLSPLLSPDLLHLLASMGHGDEVVLVDANFPGAATAARGGGRLVSCLGVDAPTMLRAVLSVFPLDTAVSQPVAYMKVCDTPAGYTSALQQSVIALLAETGSADPAQCEAVERFAFYERVKQAYAIVQTGEMQPYANFTFKKGVIADSLA